MMVGNLLSMTKQGTMNNYNTLALLLIVLSLLSCKNDQKTTIKSTPPAEVLRAKPEQDGNLEGKTIEELSILRNEIFARKGYIFKDDYLNTYFSRQEWYVPNEAAQIILTDLEKERIASIKKAEALRAPFKLPQGYKKIAETNRHNKPMNYSISKDIDGDQIIDLIQVAKNEDGTSKVIFIYLSKHKKIQKLYIADDDEEYNETTPYLSLVGDTIKYGFNYPGTGLFTRDFELIYNPSLQNLQLITYKNSHRIMFGHTAKEYNLLSGEYEVMTNAATIYDTSKMTKTTHQGEQKTKNITPDMIDENLYSYLDNVGKEFDEDPYEDQAEKQDCRELLIKKLQLEFEYGKLNYLGRDDVYKKELIDFITTVNIDALINSEDNSYSKSYRLHRDWNLNYIKEDECEDELFIEFDITNNSFIIQINNCSLYKEEGETIESSEQSTMFQYQIGKNCSYKFIRVTGAG